MMNIEKLVIVGSGLMGSGIAQVAAQAGKQVILNDVSAKALEKAKDAIAWSVKKFVEKKKVQEDEETILSRISFSESLDMAGDAQIGIEAVYENMDLKRDIFKALDQVLPPTALIATNTSAIPITEIATATQRPDKVLGLHFFSPVPMMQAVEVIKGIETSDETLAAGIEFARSIGKDPIQVNRDVAGFVINRINFPSTMEAMRLVEQGVASCEDIDKGMRLAAGRKMGIFETGDMVGLDITYGALMAMYRETGDSAWFPPLLLRRKIKAGHLGRKTGKGWYEYNEDGSRKS
jgi:3-hydroxybutyryl-CoA dehydrogenase